MAQCDNGDFGAFTVRNRNATATIADDVVSINAGTASVTVPLSVAIADLNINANTGTFQTEVRTELPNWTWRLFADTRQWIAQTEAEVEYEVVGTGLVSVLDSSSRIGVEVAERDRDVLRFPGRRTRFRGFLDVILDYSEATRAGAYTGQITVTARCQ